MKKVFTVLLPAMLACSFLVRAQQDSMMVQNGAFKLKLYKHGLGGIWRVNDAYATNYVRSGRVFGDVLARYTKNGVADSAYSANGSAHFEENGKTLNEWTAPEKKAGLQIDQSFQLNGDALTWTIRLHNNSTAPLSVEDLALPLLYNNQGGENPRDIFEQRVIKHHFISGNNSFFFWERPTGLGPYLVMVPLPGTSLEYFAVSPVRGSGPTFQAFIHARYTGSRRQGSWRQPFTGLSLAADARHTYGFRFRWAKDYQGVRDILAEEGLIDVHVAPGMTVPNDLEALVALRTREKISRVEPEFPQQTRIEYKGEKQKGTHLYSIQFSRLGENKLTVYYGNGSKTYLEFFATEPLATLYKKRSAFIVNSQQHKDPAKWYDGLFSVWDMKSKVLRGPDNDDGFNQSRLTYLLTCDDPALCKAPFVAAKNVTYPNQQEIDAVEYYIQHYVWGKLQRTDQETPYPYGVYGTPNWYVNRDTARRRANTADKNQDKMHVWRSYDYPHIMMMYYHLYQIAKLYPGMTHYLDQKGYLIRAKETAKAFFKYPYEILPWYETYKWGCYNELLILNLIEDLKKEGYPEDAQWLTKEWEKKAKYFIYDDPYPFRSEYAVDATAYESTHALARYALQHPMQPDSLLWFDKNQQRWYSHPKVTQADARRFMEAQMNANIACRGWLEPAYYYMGSDFRGRSDSYLLSYMAQMGGWSVLDYGLNWTADPALYIRLGYASYLSSFALMNTGTPQSNYGFWYGGKENDGATGWAFEPQQTATPWILKPQERGPWYYDGEIDLGYGGATRTAATVITQDPVFGLIAYGGSLSQQGQVLKVVPKDGLQQKIYYRNAGKKIDIELNRDGFASGEPVLLDPAGLLRCTLENRTAGAHHTTITLRGFNGRYTIAVDGKNLPPIDVKAAGTDITVPAGAGKKYVLSVHRVV